MISGNANQGNSEFFAGVTKAPDRPHAAVPRPSRSGLPVSWDLECSSATAGAGRAFARPSAQPLASLVSAPVLEASKNAFNQKVERSWHRRSTSEFERNRMQACEDFCNDAEPSLRRKLANFHHHLLALQSQAPRDADGKEIHYLGRLARHIEATWIRPGTIVHDMDIVISETLSFIVRKLVIPFLIHK